MARRKDKYDVDPDLIRSLEEEPDDYDYDYDEDEYDDDEPLSSGRVKWAWIFLFLALGVLIGALVFSLVGKNHQRDGATITVTTSIVSTENELLAPTEVSAEDTSSVTEEGDTTTKASIVRTTYYVIPNTTKRITTRTASTTRVTQTTTESTTQSTTQSTTTQSTTTTQTTTQSTTGENNE